MKDLALLEEHFRKVSLKTQRIANGVKVKGLGYKGQGIKGFFINTTTAVELKPTDDGFLAVASVEVLPGGILFLIGVVLLLTFILWPIPIVLYFFQRKKPRVLIEGLLARAKDDISAGILPAKTTTELVKEGVLETNVKALGSPVACKGIAAMAHAGFTDGAVFPNAEALSQRNGPQGNRPELLNRSRKPALDVFGCLVLRHRTLAVRNPPRS
jgi:hypothetical protein